MAFVQHLVFLTSFASVFVTLFLGSRLLGQKLREAGYDISKLILYGLDTPETPPAHTSKDMAAVLPDFVQDLLKQYGLTPADVQAPLAIFVTLATTFVLYKAFAGGSSADAFSVSLGVLGWLTCAPQQNASPSSTRKSGNLSLWWRRSASRPTQPCTSSSLAPHVPTSRCPFPMRFSN